MKPTPRGLAATTGFHTLPEKGVIPDLGSIVENGGFFRHTGAFHNNFLQRLTCPWRAGD